MKHNKGLYLEKVLGVLLEYRIQGEMEQMSMFISFVMIEVDEVFNVEMRTDVFYILQSKQNTNEIMQLTPIP